MVFKELYYWMYFYLRKIKSNYTPATDALFFVSFLLWINVESILIILVNNLNHWDQILVTVFGSFGLFVLITFINRILIYNQRNSICIEYDKMQKNRRIKGKTFYWIYVVFSFSFIFTVVKFFVPDPNNICRNNIALNDSTYITQNDYVINVHEVMDSWLKEHLKQNIVLDSLGIPDKKGNDDYWEAIGEYVQQWEYRNKGIILDMKSEKFGGVKELLSITIIKPCKLTTAQGIGIGSSEKEVREKYAGLIDTENSTAEIIVVGSIYGGTVFTLHNGAVIKIFIGAAAE